MCRLCDAFLHIEQLFPNVETLKFANLEIHKDQLFKKSWPNLKHFMIENIDGKNEYMEQIALNGEIIYQHWIKMVQNVRKVKILMLLGEWENDSVATENVDVIKTVPELQELFLSAQLTTDHIIDLLMSCASFKFFVFVTPLIGNDIIELKHDSMQIALDIN